MFILLKLGGMLNILSSFTLFSTRDLVIVQSDSVLVSILLLIIFDLKFSGMNDFHRWNELIEKFCNLNNVIGILLLQGQTKSFLSSCASVPCMSTPKFVSKCPSRLEVCPNTDNVQKLLSYKSHLTSSSEYCSPSTSLVLRWTKIKRRCKLIIQILNHSALVFL